MSVHKEHFVDASEQRGDGGYDYYYAYNLYTFETDRRQLTARRYDDDADEASFLCAAERRKRPAGWRSAQILPCIPYEDPLFQGAADHLINAEGVTRLSILLPSGYVSIDLAKIA